MARHGSGADCGSAVDGDRRNPDRRLAAPAAGALVRGQLQPPGRGPAIRDRAAVPLPRPAVGPRPERAAAAVALHAWHARSGQMEAQCGRTGIGIAADRTGRRACARLVCAGAGTRRARRRRAAGLISLRRRAGAWHNARLSRADEVMMADNSVSRWLRSLAADGRLWWLLLLLPVVLFLPALPIDETRYLAVAWEMRLHGDFLVPHLNGAPYSDKPPLLFWLINVGWFALGMQAWSVRVGVLAASFASLYLFERLVRRLDPDAALAQRAALVLAGIIYFALFSSAIMFDVVLTTCVLVALHGALDLDAQRWRRGTSILALGIGLGVLAKGPVVLLDAGMVLVFGPIWSETARAHRGRWYACVGLGVL